MKIKVGSTYICEGNDRAGWVGPIGGQFPRNVSDQEEPVASIRATSKLILDRKNEHNEFPLRVSKAYGSTALAYAAQLALTSLAGTITFETGATNYTMVGKAKLVSVNPRGVRLDVDWILIGGAITT
jgi:hypothetical protein